MKAKRKLKNFDFSGEDAHMALVNSDQMGPANGITTLVLKSADQFTEKQLESIKQIVKSANGFSDAEAEEYLAEMLTKDAGGDGPDSEVKRVNNDANPIPAEQENNMDAEMIQKSEAEALIAKAVEDATKEAVQKAVEAKEAEIAELTKSLKAFEEEKAAQEKAEFVAKAKGFEELGVEDAEAFGVALMKMSKDEVFEPVLAALEKAQNIVKQMNTLEQERGHDVEPADANLSGVMAAIKARKSAK